MRTAVGSTWLYGLIIIFTLIFTGFLVLTLTYSKAYKLKNEMLSIIEKYEGITTTSSKGDGSIPIINQYLKNSGYIGKGKCKTNEYAPSSLDDDTLSRANGFDTYPYCVSYYTNSNNNMTTFSVKVFFNINIPVLRQLNKYEVTGSTYDIAKAICFDRSC